MSFKFGLGLLLMLLLPFAADAAKAYVPEDVQHASEQCMDLRYSSVQGGGYDRKRSLSAISSCTEWQEYAEVSRPTQMPLIDALLLCHKSYYDQEEAVERAKKAIEGLKHLNSPLARSAKFSAHMCAIKSYMELRRWDQLRAHASLASEQVALFPQAHWLLWKAFFLSGDFDQAEKHIRLLGRISRDPTIYVHLSETLILNGKYEEGIATIKGLENAARRYLGLDAGLLHELEFDPFRGNDEFLKFREARSRPTLLGGGAAIAQANEDARQRQREEQHVQNLKNLLKINLSQTFEAKAHNLAGDYAKAYEILEPFLNKPVFQGPAQVLLNDEDVPEGLKKSIKRFIQNGGSPSKTVKIQEKATGTIAMWQERAHSLVGLAKYGEAASLLEKMGTSFPDRSRYLDAAIAVSQANQKSFMAEFYSKEKEGIAPYVTYFKRPLADDLRRQLAAFMPKTLVRDGEWVDGDDLTIFEELKVVEKSGGGLVTKSRKKKKRQKGLKIEAKSSRSPNLEIRGSENTIPAFLSAALFRAASDFLKKEKRDYIEVRRQSALLVHEVSLTQIGPIEGDRKGDDSDSFSGYAADLEGVLYKSTTHTPAQFNWLSKSELDYWLEVAGYKKSNAR